MFYTKLRPRGVEQVLFGRFDRPEKCLTVKQPANIQSCQLGHTNVNSDVRLASSAYREVPEKEPLATRTYIFPTGRDYEYNCCTQVPLNVDAAISGTII